MAPKTPERAQPPFTVRQSEAAYWVEDANGMAFAYCYFDRQIIGTGPARPSRDLARRLAVWIAKLPDMAVAAETQKSPPPR